MLSAVSEKQSQNQNQFHRQLVFKGQQLVEKQLKMIVSWTHQMD